MNIFFLHLLKEEIFTQHFCIVLFSSISVWFHFPLYVGQDSLEEPNLSDKYLFIKSTYIEIVTTVADTWDAKNPGIARSLRLTVLAIGALPQWLSHTGEPTTWSLFILCSFSNLVLKTLKVSGDLMVLS